MSVPLFNGTLIRCFAARAANVNRSWEMMMTIDDGRTRRPRTLVNNRFRIAGGPRMLGVLVATVASLSGLGVGIGANNASADAWVSVPCQWAGKPYPHGTTVHAGGWPFTCASDTFGAPQWIRHAADGHPDTVDSPGANSAAAEGYSVGAWQPGTSFFDYCVGDNGLIPGTDYVFEAVPFNGNVFWRTAAPISDWTAGPTAHHRYTWPDSRYCINGLVE